MNRKYLIIRLATVLVAFFLLVWPLDGEEPAFLLITHGLVALVLCAYLIWQEVSNRRRARNFFRVIDSMADWSLVVGADGRVVHASETVRRYGYQPDLILGMDWADLTPLANHDKVKAWISQVGTGTPGQIGPFLAEMANTQGLYRSYEVSVCRLEFGGHRYFAGLFRDVTERLQMERAMTSIDRMATVAHLADGVAHNFNNIFGGIMLNTELLLHAREPEREALADRIVAGAERGAELCRKLLTLARGEAPQFAAVAVGPLVADLVALVETNVGSRGLTICNEMDDQLVVWADSGQLRQILIDLLFNASEAAGEGGWIRISGFRTVDGVTVAISNSGAPIPPEHLTMIFQPFFSTKTERVQATGLGLAVSRRLAEGMGGGLDVASGPQQATTFTLRLPAEQPVREDGTPTCAF